MKCLLIAMLCALVVVGCMGPVLKAFQKENPGKPAYPVYDKPNDGIPDAYAYDNDNDGVPETEVAGSREQLEQVGFLGDNIGALLALALGGTGLTGLARYWSRLQPLKRLAHAEAMFTGVVGSVQKVRESKDITPDVLAVINQILKEAQGEIVGIKEAIAKAKETNT